MKMILQILLVFVCLSASGASVDQLSVTEQEYLNAVLLASNDVEKVQAAYDSIKWDRVEKPVRLLRVLSKALKGRASLVAIRRDVKTKYLLLREEGDVDLEDKVSPTVIPVIAVEKVAVESIPFVTISPEIDQWKSRYDSRLDGGLRISSGTVLGRQRKVLDMTTTNYDQKLMEYNDGVRRALNRRSRLSE